MWTLSDGGRRVNETESTAARKWLNARILSRLHVERVGVQWRSIRFRLALRKYAPWGVRVVSLTKSRKIPTRKTLPLFPGCMSSEWADTGGCGCNTKAGCGCVAVL